MILQVYLRIDTPDYPKVLILFYNTTLVKLKVTHSNRSWVLKYLKLNVLICPKSFSVHKCN